MKTFDVTQDYNREDFLEFLSDFLPEDYTMEEEQSYYEYINIEEGYKLGTCDSLDLDVFEFRTKSNRDPRVTLTREVVSFMKKYGSNQNALVVFYSNDSHNWRFSLITTDYEIINGKIKPLYSNPRRFSFRLGGECKAHTPNVMLFKKGQICEHTENGKTVTAIEDLKNRFALEVVSKQFFDEYKVFYEDFVQYITGNRYVKVGGKYERKPVSKENTKIFNQFKKLANGDYELACKYVRDYIKKFMGRLVFLQFLQKKGWLGVAEKDSWGNGNKNFLLDLFTSSNNKNDFLEKVLEPLFFGMLNTDIDDREKLFKEKEWDIALLDEFKQIPYLNGGLFEDDNLDKIEIKFPQEMFSNPAKADKERTFNDKKDYSKELYPFTESCGLLDFFARYNFTIDETDPADMEIGVEPEMLGKIFENLLEDNKDKGAFYTPKEIVQYMCRESLIAYLGDNEKVRSLVTTHNADYTDSEKTELIKKLKEVKVCDPAVGSGAFPMGMLNELFACRIALGENEDAAEIKKQIVRENIYGVDIEKGAVDIARLRFWLAIIVDEKEPIPLPNLDYKIMQGNSLLENFDGIDLSKLTEKRKIEDGYAVMFEDSDEIIQQLKNAVDGFYVPNDHEAKTKIRNQISEQVIQLLKERQLPPATIKKLETIDLHSNSEFFLWHTWFGDVFNRPNNCNGFDIVIGNPPYGVSIKNDYRNKVINALGKVPDYEIYYYFVELSKNLISNNGILSYIIPNTWLFNTFAKNYRISTTEYWNIKEILDCSKFKIFEAATVYNTIILFQKSKNFNEKVIYRPTELATNFMELISQKRQFLSKAELLKMNQNWGLAFKISPEIISIIQKIKSNTTELQTLFPEISQGLIAYDKYKGQSEEIIKSRAYHSFTFKKGYKKNLWGEDVTRYSCKWNGQEYINYCDGIANPRKPKFFKGARILVREITNPRIFACYTDEELYNDPSLLIVLSSNNYDIKVLLGILNSKLATFYHFNNSPKATKGGFPKILIEDLKLFPLPNINEMQKKHLSNLVDKNLCAKKKDVSADITSVDDEIDELVYELYGLKEKEIAFIKQYNA